MSDLRLVDIAPRLAAAHAWVRRTELERDRRRRDAVNDVLRLERLVAHRELQLVRAGGRRQGAYLAERHHKLAHAQAALDRARRRLHALDREADRRVA